MLWIAFKICIFDIGNSSIASFVLSVLVVNCFQNLYLWHRKQQIKQRNWAITVVNCFQNLYLWHRKQPLSILRCQSSGCELLSKFVSLTSETAWSWKHINVLLLWIAFKICIFDIGNSEAAKLWQPQVVVNCFQNLYLWHRKQHLAGMQVKNLRCELLSKFVSLTSETAKYI